MIPNKSNFKFEELTPITGVKPYVIRFWETEFEEIDPVTSDSGVKLYARKDIEAILKIKKLLFENKLSIPEARVQMKNGPEVSEAPVSASGSKSKDREDAKNLILKSLDLIQEIKFKRKW